nr:zinc finger protein 37 isoform X3 [Crassostrea gigas]
MNPQNYHKVYMNHVHSSTLLSQLSTMWKSQTLCDAMIKTGAVTTRAHRVVLVAACPMLQTMENATSGSHLEVRLASDISQESVNTFLQYLYEGYMILTEENCSEVEKIARLLQVDSITKCCADFNKTINKSAGAQFRYSFQDQTDFKHMRVSDLFKKQERSTKRSNEMHRPLSPSIKRQRIHTSSSPKIHDTSSMAESYGATADPWDRVPRLGSGFQGPGVVDIREDGFELVQTEPPKKDSSGSVQEPVKVQTSVSLSVSSQHNHSSDLRVVNVLGDPGPPAPDRAGKSSQAAPSSSGASSRDPITVSPLTFQDSPSSSSSSVDISRSMGLHDKTPHKKDADKSTHPKVHIPDYSEQQFSSEMMNSSSMPRSSEDSSSSYRAPYPVAMTQIPRQPAPKPFASGSASQSLPVFPETLCSPSSQKSQSTPRESIERPPSIGRGGESGKEKGDEQPDLSIVKIETATERDMSNLEMYMGGEESFGSHGHPPIRTEEDDPGPDYSVEEPPTDWQREDASNESSNVSGMDSSGNWYMGQMKGKGKSHKEPAPDDQPLPSPSSANKVPVSRQQETFSCVFCSTTCNNRENLKRHVEINHNNPFETYLHYCEYCGRGFKSKEGFVLHTRMFHTETEKFPQCQICGKRFHCASSYKTHMYSHSGQKRYKCLKCHKSYKNKVTWTKHVCRR